MIRFNGVSLAAIHFAVKSTGMLKFLSQSEENGDQKTEDVTVYFLYLSMVDV